MENLDPGFYVNCQLAQMIFKQQQTLKIRMTLTVLKMVSSEIHMISCLEKKMKLSSYHAW